MDSRDVNRGRFSYTVTKLARNVLLGVKLSWKHNCQVRRRAGPCRLKVVDSVWAWRAPVGRRRPVVTSA